MRNSTENGRMRVLLISCILGVGVSLEASSQPEKIRTGQRDYSDSQGEHKNQGMVRCPGPDKNDADGPRVRLAPAQPRNTCPADAFAS